MTSERSSAIAPFSRLDFSGFRGVSRTLLLVLVFVLMSLPLFTTFNELLTKVVEGTGAYQVLAKYVVPFETRAVSLILRPFGIESSPTISHLFIENTPPPGLRLHRIQIHTTYRAKIVSLRYD